jgi:hypothetical protein
MAGCPVAEARAGRGGEDMRVKALLAVVVIVAFAGLALSAAAMAAEKKTETPKPGPEHKKLDAFVGTWTGDGEMKKSPFGPAGKVTWTETCDWLTGGFQVMCKSKSTGPMGTAEEVAVIGYDSENKDYVFFGADSMGWIGSARGEATKEGWNFKSEDKVKGKMIKSRFKMRTPTATTMTSKWEMMNEAGVWEVVSEGKATKK